MRGITKGALALGAAVAALATPASATHSWGGYHWARTANPFTLQLGDNVDGRWDAYLVNATADWNKGTIVKSKIVPGTSAALRCRGVVGTIQVCNYTYGRTGWLGIASISISGTHITQGTVKLNDTYYNTAQYNTPAWRQMVMCQEVAHDFGLAHQDEGFGPPNLGSCMDYTNAPSGGGGYGLSNEHPNSHDFDMLAQIYNHRDTTTTVAATSTRMAAAWDPGLTLKEWGRPVKFLRDGRPHVFQREDGRGQITLTHVFWALGEGPQHDEHDH
jgi:hypothetical protein